MATISCAFAVSFRVPCPTASHVWGLRIVIVEPRWLAGVRGDDVTSDVDGRRWTGALELEPGAAPGAWSED